MVFNCNQCGKPFTRAFDLARHRASVHENVKYTCAKCSNVYTRKDILIEHIKTCNDGRKRKASEALGNKPSKKRKNKRTWKCETCNEEFDSLTDLRKHLVKAHPPLCSKCNRPFKTRRGWLQHQKVCFRKCLVCSESIQSSLYDEHMRRHDVSEAGSSRNDTAASTDNANNEKLPAGTFKEPKPKEKLKDQFRTVEYTPGSEEKDFLLFLASLETLLLDEINTELETTPCKWYMAARLRFERDTGEELELESWIRTKVFTTLHADDPQEQVRLAFADLIKTFTEFTKDSSQWIISCVLEFKLHIFKYTPLAGSSFIPLPPELKFKKAITNVQNDNDEKCFLWAVLAAIHPAVTNAHRVANYEQYENELDMSGLSFPMKVSQTAKFERQNQISVNVFGYENKQFFPIHISKYTDCVKVVDLLLISNGEKQHYCTISNINRLFSSLTKHKEPCFYCRYCLHRFYSERTLNEHRTTCVEFGPQNTRMPTEENKWLQFNKQHFQMKMPFYIVGDFECLAKPTNQRASAKNQTESFTVKEHKHVPCGFSYYVVGPSIEHCKEPVVYRGNDSVKVLLEMLSQEEEEITRKYTNPVPIRMSTAEEIAFKNATKCHICEQPLFKSEPAVRDHCHITGKYRGAAHNKCNLQYRVPKKVPILFHNLSKYDAHLIMQGVGEDTADKVSCIAVNFEEYISFTLDNLTFLDSLRFLGASLDTLVKNLLKSGLDKFQHLSEWFEADKLDLLLRKGVYPYEYFNSMEKFKETQLPPKSEFYNKLTDSDITDEDYEHAQNVWNAFGMKTLGDYHDLYVKTDVQLLACVFENFRDICYKGYGLDCLHVYTAPGLSWEAALKMTGVKLELLTDIDMYQFVEMGLRGGVSMISKRYAEANNPYMGEQYNPSEPNSYIWYIDANNLYGWSMSQPLPVSDFKWLNCNQMSKMTADRISQIEDDATYGYILEVDLNYPEELHDMHSDFPLAPEKMSITEDMLSPHSREIERKLAFKHFESTKLVPNLYNKEKYILHYRNLKLYLKLGMELSRVHNVLRFKQEPWLKRYIDYNTEMRRNATSDAEKDFYKLMNNAVFGRSMMNLRKRKNITIITDADKLRKNIASPAFHDLREFKPDLIAIQKLQSNLLLDKPLYTGFCILDLSKVLMYEMFYKLKSKYGENMQLLFTDTDSICTHIYTDDIYQDMAADLDTYDTSDFPTDHFLHSNKNKKLIGKFKDETNGVPITAFVGLRPKMYAMKVAGVDKKTAKGISKTAIRKILTFEKFKETLFECKADKIQMTRFQSVNHQIYTVRLSKTGLSPADDKRFLLDDGVNSTAHGHFANWMVQ